MKTQAINKMSVTAPISGKIIPITRGDRDHERRLS